MNTGILLTAIAFITFLVLMYMFIKQLLKLLAIILTMFIIFASYIYIKNGSLPKDLKGYLEEGKVTIEKLHQAYSEITH